MKKLSMNVGNMFKLNQCYSRREIKVLLGYPDYLINNNSFFSEGYPRLQNVFFVFVNLYESNRRNQNYPNKYYGNKLIWISPDRKTIFQRNIKNFLNVNYTKLFFIRFKEGDKFIYKGQLVEPVILKKEDPVMVDFTVEERAFIFNNEELKSINKYMENLLLRYYNDNPSKLVFDAKNGNEQPIRTVMNTTFFHRSLAISEYVKHRSKGICELCKNPAPFLTKNGTPYLETHHVVSLSNDGVDTIYNTIALCPNCHREIHYGILSKEKYYKLMEVLYQALIDDDNTNEKDIEKFINYHQYNDKVK